MKTYNYTDLETAPDEVRFVLIRWSEEQMVSIIAVTLFREKKCSIFLVLTPASTDSSALRRSVVVLV